MLEFCTLMPNRLLFTLLPWPKLCSLKQYPLSTWIFSFVLPDLLEIWHSSAFGGVSSCFFIPPVKMVWARSAQGLSVPSFVTFQVFYTCYSLALLALSMTKP